jgi:hypothetical protein
MKEIAGRKEALFFRKFKAALEKSRKITRSCLA